MGHEIGHGVHDPGIVGRCDLQWIIRYQGTYSTGIHPAIGGLVFRLGPAQVHIPVSMFGKQRLKFACYQVKIQYRTAVLVVMVAVIL